MRIAHISDPHFATISYDLSQFFSKRWLGNTNLLLFRHKTHQTDHLNSLPTLFASLKVDLVALTGDLTTTSSDQEYIKAKTFVNTFPMPVVLLPGNHDIYTKESEVKRRFYGYFPSSAEQAKVEVKEIQPGFWWVGLNCAYASNLFLSNGKFTTYIETHLRSVLEVIPKEAMVIMGNHFPLMGKGNPRHDLLGAKKLQALLKEYPNVKLYLHGHDHLPYLLDKRAEGLPIICNSGSVSHLPEGGFSILDYTKESCFWQRYAFQKDGSWQLIDTKLFTF